MGQEANEPGSDEVGADLRTIRCRVCGTAVTFERLDHRPPSTCSKECRDFVRMTQKWACAARKLFGQKTIHEEATGAVTPKGLRMRLTHAIREAADEVVESATEAAEDARETIKAAKVAGGAA
jgi:hypothetical protein